MAIEYIPPASAGAIATRREIEPVEEPVSPPTVEGRLARVTVELSDGTVVEFDGCHAVRYDITCNYDTYRIGGDPRYAHRVHDRSEGKLELTFRDVRVVSRRPHEDIQRVKDLYRY